MSNITQLSANEAFDDFNAQPLGEGFITLRTSAGNRRLYRSPAEANMDRLGNPGAFGGTPDGAGSFNEADQNPTTT